jgi:hypothetical protein
MKILTPSGIDPATFRFVMQCRLNHCSSACPCWELKSAEKLLVKGADVSGISSALVLKFLFNSDEESIIILRNIGEYLPVDTA